MRKIWLLIIILWGGKSFAQVNLQTGSATFNLPVFNWQDNKSRLNLDIFLSYNSGNGLKVSDVASNVGQGWNLIAGGLITRSQVGEPDDQKPYEGIGTDDITRYPPGYLYDSLDASLGVSNSLAKYPLYKDKNHLYKQHNSVAADKELDQFAFQFNGRSGAFVLDKTSGDKGILLGDSKMKVWFVRDETMSNQGIRTTIDTFYIMDENGLKYKFSKHELTTILKTRYCDVNFKAKYTQPTFSIGQVYRQASFADTTIKNPKVITAWYLSEIEDSLTHRKITFNYELREINNYAGAILSYHTENPDAGYPFQSYYSIISHSTSVTSTPVISSVTYPDGHLVEFNYGSLRVDLSGGKALASIDITYQNRHLSKYQLHTSYFILNRYGIPQSNYQKSMARLCLLSVKKTGVDLKGDEPPYFFDYYLGSGNPDDYVPPPFYHHKDIWGYYNGDYSHGKSANSTIPVNSSLSKLNNDQIGGLCFLRGSSQVPVLNAKPGYAKNGLLKQIIYPTKGSLKYDYEQNEGIIDGQSLYVGGVHVSATSFTDGGYSNGCGNPIITNYKYKLEGSAASSLWGLEKPINKVSMMNHYKPELKRYRFPFSCRFVYQYPGILSIDQSVSLTPNQKFWAAVANVANIVGTIGTGYDVVNLIFLSSGVGAVAAVIFDAFNAIVSFVTTCLLDPTQDNLSVIYYNSDLNGTNPLPVQFKRVEVTEGNGANGKTITEFTSPDDYPIWVNQNETFSMEQRYAYWAYGLPKKITVYDSAGNPVKQTENDYNFDYAKETFDYYDHYGVHIWRHPSCKYVIKKSSSQRITDWDNLSIYNNQAAYTKDLTSNPDMMAHIYDISTGRVELRNSYERVFKKNSASQYAQTTTSYYYNTNYLVHVIIIAQSNGDEISKYINYNDDFNGTALNLLTQANIFSVPVEEYTQFKKAGTSQYFYLGETVAEFTITGNDEVKPQRTLVQRFTQPQASMTSYYGPGSPYNPPSYKETQFFTYNSDDNLIGIRDEGHRTVANIYDYNEKYIVASVVNADPVYDKPAYTSFETENLGGWLLTGASAYSTANSITGIRSFNMGSGSLKATSLNVSKPYKLSFWANNANVAVSAGATLAKSGPSINTFTYYEYNIAQGTATVTVSGNSVIDELRLYPQTARMKSVTYDPLIGKTSECDENNRVTYYEYDDLGRLRFVKDENKNIIKMNEYNTASSGCSTTYSNLAISEIFTKNNCDTGYIGSEVSYTIPADKYTSTISQEAVDMQAQNELDTEGQAYANAHGNCIKLYYNISLSEPFYKQGCDIGYKGNAITYMVPAGKYTSTLSQADADGKAQYDINANGQAYANTSPLGACVIDTEGDWSETGDNYCSYSHRWLELKNDNPNSPTYNHVQWADGGVDPACPPLSVIYGRVEKENIVGFDPEYCDFVIRFYADPNYTIPYSVNGYTVDVNIWEFRSGQYSYSSQESVICDGFETLIGSNILTYQSYGWEDMYILDYSLNQNTFPLP